MSPASVTPPPYFHSPLFSPLELNCLGFLFVFALKIGATYARLFLASLSSLFGFYCCCFSLVLLCTFCIFFTSCLLLFYAFAVLCFAVFAMNHAPVVRQFELTLRGVGAGRREGTEDSRLINNHQSSYTQ